MLCNLSKVWMDSCRACIKKCQECVQACQKSIACLTSDKQCDAIVQECATIIRACIDTCKQCMQENDTHARECADKECVIGCQEAIGTCMASMPALQECAKHCAAADVRSVVSLKKCIAACNACIAAYENAIEM